MPARAIPVPLARPLLGRVDDVRLATLAAAGDERAFEALYDRHHLALLGFCRHMLRSHDEAEDALQQTFLRAHRALLAHGAPEELRPWLFAIARNRCKTLLAARRPEAAAGEEVEPATEGLGTEVERRADLRALLADLERLPEDQRSALVLAELADLSHPEIAAVIGVPASKVKALVHQARSRLIADREARETPCERVREQLATAHGGALRRGPLRRHLRGCEPCRAYRAAVAEQRKALRLVLPALPSAGLKEAVFGAISGGGGGTAAAAGGAATAVSAGSGALSGGGAGAVSIAAKGIGAKLAVGAVLAGGAGAGTAVIADVGDRPQRDVPPAAAVRATALGDGQARPVSATGAETELATRENTQAQSRRRYASKKPKAGKKRGRKAGGLAHRRAGGRGQGGEARRQSGGARGQARGRAGDQPRGHGEPRGHGLALGGGNGQGRSATAPPPNRVPTARAQGRRTYRVKPRAPVPKPVTPPKTAKPVKTPAPVPDSQPRKAAEPPAAELAP
jgi:RNA polymerase sigma factor (sigma-70 family)